MIRLTFTQCKWGTDRLDGGVQINLLDEQSGIFAHVPFSGDSLLELAKALSDELTPGQRSELRGHLSGIELPPREEGGPQG